MPFVFGDLLAEWIAVIWVPGAGEQRRRIHVELPFLLGHTCFPQVGKARVLQDQAPLLFRVFSEVHQNGQEVLIAATIIGQQFDEAAHFHRHDQHAQSRIGGRFGFVLPYGHGQRDHPGVGQRADEAVREIEGGERLRGRAFFWVQVLAKDVEKAPVPELFPGTDESPVDVLILRGARQKGARVIEHRPAARGGFAVVLLHLVQPALEGDLFGRAERFPLGGLEQLLEAVFGGLLLQGPPAPVDFARDFRGHRLGCEGVADLRLIGQGLGRCGDGHGQLGADE
jgi:hypothetical protein